MEKMKKFLVILKRVLLGFMKTFDLIAVVIFVPYSIYRFDQYLKYCNIHDFNIAVWTMLLGIFIVLSNFYITLKQK